MMDNIRERKEVYVEYAPGWGARLTSEQVDDILEEAIERAGAVDEPTDSDGEVYLTRRALGPASFLRDAVRAVYPQTLDEPWFSLVYREWLPQLENALDRRRSSNRPPTQEEPFFEDDPQGNLF